MAITLTELSTGRKNSITSSERLYRIHDPSGPIDDEEAALSALLSGAEETIGTKELDEAQCGVEEFDEGVYIGTAVYSNNVIEQAPDTFSIAFDISGQQQKITQSRSTIASYGAEGETTKDFKGAINVQQDGTVEGTEIVIPFLTYTLTYTFSDEAITAEYRNETLPSIVGTVNNGTFKGAPAGELLLTRVSGQQRDDGNWDLTYAFAISRNVEDLEVGDITVAAKQGWDYLWVYYEERETDSYLRKVPISAYVERVYPRSNYASLGI